MDTMTDAAGNEWVPLFLNEEAISGGQTGNIIIPVSLEDVLRFGYEWESVKGVVIDPFGSQFIMTKDLLHKILSREKIQV